jgi:putative transposase
LGGYTLANGRGRRATVRVCVRCRNYAGERGRSGRQRLVYAFWGVSPPGVEWVRREYRRRFGIESSYRQMNQARASTCTRNPLVRLLYVGVALILRNVWVWLHWQVLSVPRRGGREMRPGRLRFKELLAWLGHVIEERFGVVDRTHTDRLQSQAFAA